MKTTKQLAATIARAAAKGWITSDREATLLRELGRGDWVDASKARGVDVLRLESDAGDVVFFCGSDWATHYGEKCTELNVNDRDRVKNLAAFWADCHR